VFSVGLGVSHLVRPWLLDRVDVQFFNSGGATVWLTEGEGFGLAFLVTYGA
jgi:hypothetical protein